MISTQTITEFLANHEAGYVSQATARLRELKAAEARCDDDAEYERIEADIWEAEVAQTAFITALGKQIEADGIDRCDYFAVMAAAKALAAK